MADLHQCQLGETGSGALDRKHLHRDRGEELGAHPSIERLRNCKELKKAPGEDIINYETQVKHYREAAGNEILSSEKSSVLFVILMANGQKFTDKCLNRLQVVWKD